MNYTQNYQLPQWVETDRILRTDFNDAFDTIETAMSGFGNCKIETGSYTGTGGNSNTLTFSSQPLLVVVSDRASGLTLLMMYPCLFGISLPLDTASGNKVVGLTWSSGNTLTWVRNNTPEYLANINGRQYHYIALLAA